MSVVLSLQRSQSSLIIKHSNPQKTQAIEKTAAESNRHFSKLLPHNYTMLQSKLFDLAIH